MDSWASFIYLTTAGTVGVFLLLLFVVRRWTASASSYLFVLAPAVSIPAAALLLDESLRSPFLAGSLLIVIGVYVGAFAPGSQSSALQEAET
jgi:drug/metabolite transporter (DMT)-like permease